MVFKIWETPASVVGLKTRLGLLLDVKRQASNATNNLINFSFEITHPRTPKVNEEDEDVGQISYNYIWLPVQMKTHSLCKFCKETLTETARTRPTSNFYLHFEKNILKSKLGVSDTSKASYLPFAICLCTKTLQKSLPPLHKDIYLVAM